MNPNLVDIQQKNSSRTRQVDFVPHLSCYRFKPRASFLNDSSLTKQTHDLRTNLKAAEHHCYSPILVHVSDSLATRTCGVNVRDCIWTEHSK